MVYKNKKANQTNRTKNKNSKVQKTKQKYNSSNDDI